MPRHDCALCGQISFNTYHEYEAHRREFHGMRSAIRPENITGRSREQIAEDAERTWLKPYLIVSDKRPEVVTMREQMEGAARPEHGPECRCMQVCFNRRLDELIKSQEASLREQGTSDATTN